MRRGAAVLLAGALAAGGCSIKRKPQMESPLLTDMVDARAGMR